MSFLSKITGREQIKALEAQNISLSKTISDLSQKVEQYSNVKSFASAAINRLTADSTTSIFNINEELKSDLGVLRARSRQLGKDNAYYHAYLDKAVRGVVGPSGFQLRLSIVDKTTGDVETFDTAAEDEIEKAWKDWSKAPSVISDWYTTYGVDSKETLLDVYDLIVKCWKRDGSCIIRKIVGWNNPYKYALQILDSHALDIYYNQMSAGKDNTVIMGVEINSFGRPVAYHFRQSIWQVPAHANIQSPTYERVRVPASEIQHIFKREQPGQTEGIPACSSCLINLQMIGGYSQAELTAARMLACKMLFYITKGVDPQGDGQGGDGTIQKIFQPGGSDILPEGVEPKLIDPTHPNADYAGFVKAQLREISSGLGVAYNNLANDLEGVNYSSMRHGRNDETDAWKREQTFVIDHFCKPIFSEWLWCYLALSGKTLLPLKKFEKFNSPIFVPRSFEWVDPKSDAEAKLLLMSKGLESPLDIGQSLGRDPYRIIDEIAALQAYAKAKNVDINFLQTANQTVQTISTDKPKDKTDETKI